MRSFSEVIKSDKPVLVDFSAEWCGPCKMMPPVLKEVKDKLQDKIIILKVDIDRNPDAARAYQVQSVPTLMVFQNGVVKWRQSGAMPANQLMNVMRQFVQASTV